MKFRLYRKWVWLSAACALALPAISGAQALASLYSFSARNSTSPFGNADGAEPETGLIQAKDGNLYGTTSAGGTSGSGTVFKITPKGMLTSLYSFSGGADGAVPYAGLIQAKDGNLYGTTSAGATGGSGTVFKITPGGMLTTLYRFSTIDSNSDNRDGANPTAGLTQAANGNLYGATDQGGTSNSGTIFCLSGVSNVPILTGLSPSSAN